jgi:hypothetical protein
MQIPEEYGLLSIDLGGFEEFEGNKMENQLRIVDARKSP